MTVKGIAGGFTSSWMRRKLGPSGTIYYYEWDNLDTGWEKWLMLKGHAPTASWDYDGLVQNKRFLYPAENKIKAACAASTGPRQWLILGNELERQSGGCEPSTQASMFKQAYDWAKSANPTMKVVFGGWNIYAPGTDKVYDGIHDLAVVPQVYQSMYGSLPPCQGVHFHAYYVQGTTRQYQYAIENALDNIGTYWGKKYIILSEWGHTSDYGRQRAAMDVIKKLKHNFHAVFWYKSCYDPACRNDPSWPCDRSACLFHYCSNVTANHGLTNIGLHYRNLDLS